MEREVTLRVEESIYEQFLASISLYKQVRVVSVNSRTACCRRGRPKKSGQPVVKAFIYGGMEASVRLMMLCKGLMALGWID